MPMSHKDDKRPDQQSSQASHHDVRYVITDDMVMLRHGQQVQHQRQQQIQRQQQVYFNIFITNIVYLYYSI